MDSAQEVGPALFVSLLIITVSFLPVFALGGAGRAALQAARVDENTVDGVGGAALASRSCR